jgi:chemotaxis signal transduction protein
VANLLTFLLGAQHFAVDVSHVDGVVAYRTLQAVPDSAAATCVRGAMMLAGQPVAVMDLRAHLGFHEAAPTSRTCIVIVSAPRDGGGRLRAGLIVDHVQGLVEINGGGDAIEPLPDAGRFDNDYFIRGVVRGDRAGHAAGLVMLDVRRVLGLDVGPVPMVSSQRPAALRLTMRSAACVAGHRPAVRSVG